MLMILDDTSTIKAFTDDTNTVNVEYVINKELHITNMWLKLHALPLQYLKNNFFLKCLLNRLIN